jgi:glutamyl-tRNA synthetase
MLARLEAQDDWAPDALNGVINDVAAELDVGMGKVAQPLRVALTGSGVSPSIDKTLWLMGKQRSIEGIEKALAYIAARVAAM